MYLIVIVIGGFISASMFVVGVSFRGEVFFFYFDFLLDSFIVELKLFGIVIFFRYFSYIRVLFIRVNDNNVIF